MSDPKRLLENWTDDLGRAVLRAAAHDVPPLAAKERAKAAAIAALSPAAAAVTTATGTTAVATSAIGLTKVLAFVGVSGVAILAGTVYLESVEKPLATTASSTMQASAAPERASSAPRDSVEVPALPPSPSPQAPSASSVVAAPPTSATNATVVPAPPAAALPPTAPAPRGSIDRESALAAELASLDRARSALAQGQASQALALLDDHAVHFPRGVLATEATVLRIEALVRAGDRASAVALAHRFLAANAASPYAPRVRSLVGEPTAP